MSDTQLADPERRVPWHAFLAMIHAAERLASDPLIALRAGVSRPPRGVLVYLSRAQGTLREALAELERNAALAADPSHLEVCEEPRTAWLRLGVDEPDFDAARRLKPSCRGRPTGSLAELPLPRWRDAEVADYCPWVVPVQTSRGCRNACHFCSTTRYQGGHPRHRPVQEIVDEIHWLRDQGVWKAGLTPAAS